MNKKDTSCRQAKYNSIQTAIEAAELKGTVVVCKGTYPGGINLDRRVNLVGKPGATIDATGDAYGIAVGASYTTVGGLTVRNANAPQASDDGIVTVGFDSGGNPTGPANHVKIIGNVLTGNAHAGVDLNSTGHSVAFGNKANGNGIGVNVADDLGVPATENLIALNVTNKNTGGCGIALADHSGAGVTDNGVLKNVSHDNGQRVGSVVHRQRQQDPRQLLRDLHVRSRHGDEQEEPVPPRHPEDRHVPDLLERQPGRRALACRPHSSMSVCGGQA